MNDLQIFNTPQFGEVRVIERNGEPWFVLKDVCHALEMDTTQLKKIADRLDEDEKGRIQITTPGGPQETWIINESGLYDVTIRSDKPKAKPLRKWVTSEVLPSIRKTGAYLTPAAEAQLRSELQALAKRMDDLTAVNDLLLDLDTRVLQLECRIDPPAGMMSIADIRPFASGNSARVSFTPGLAARKRWMRTTSEKLDLISTRFGTTHNEILHSLYQHLEKRCGVVLEEEKLKAMEEYNLGDCSVLTAIFYNSELRDAFEENIDYNLAPENRGW